MLSDPLRLSGLVGISLIIASIVIAAAFYRGRRGERYSPLNHFISELGEVGVSPAAWVFNLGLMLGGVLLLPFMLGLGMAFGSVWGWLGTLAGVTASLGAAAVGLYPMNRLTPHMRAALTYFRAGLVMVVLFALAILFQSAPVLPPAANLLSAAAALSYGAFLWLLGRPPKPGEPNTDEILGPQATAPRPRFWTMAVLEWVVFAATVAWIFGVAALS